MRRLLLLLGIGLLPALGARADVPPIYVPATPDSVSIESAPAPLLVPGRTTLADTARKAVLSRAEDQYVLGRALERQGNPGAAIAAYRNAVHLDPTMKDAHLRMGRLFMNVQQPRAAAREFAAELKVDPNLIEAARGLGLALAQTGDTTRAIPVLEKLLRKHPEDQASWQALGYAYGIAARFPQAETALRRAVSLDPRDSDAWRDLGVVLSMRGRIDPARDALRRAAALDSADVSAYIDLGNIERRANRSEAALAAYRAALARDSSAVLAWRAEISLLRELKRTDEAGKDYRALLRRQPDDESLRMEAMQFFDESGRQDIALELARDGVRQSPKSAEAHLALGMAHHAAGELRSSLVELRLAQALFKRDDQRGRVESLIGALRAVAPDSLRTLFAADSVAHPVRFAPADSTTSGR